MIHFLSSSPYGCVNWFFVVTQLVFQLSIGCNRWYLHLIRMCATYVLKEKCKYKIVMFSFCQKKTECYMETQLLLSVNCTYFYMRWNECFLLLFIIRDVINKIQQMAVLGNYWITANTVKRWRGGNAENNPRLAKMTRTPISDML